jgi:hypothetical protein
VLLSAGFWPVFWTIAGSGAMLTVALCFVVAVMPAPRARRHHQPPASLPAHRPGQPARSAGLPHAA